MPSAPLSTASHLPSPTTSPDVVFDSIDDNLDRLSGYLTAGLNDIERNDSEQSLIEFSKVERSFVGSALPQIGDFGTTRRDFRPLFVVLTLVLFGLLAAVIVSLDAGFRVPVAALINAVPGKDKAVHFLVFGGLVVPASLALGMHSVRVGRWRVLSGTLLLLTISTAEEFSQLSFTSRTFDLFDLTANYLGIAFFTLIVTQFRLLK